MEGLIIIFVLLGLVYLVLPWIALSIAAGAGRKAEALTVELRALREQVLKLERHAPAETQAPQYVEPSMPPKAAPPTVPVTPATAPIAPPPVIKPVAPPKPVADDEIIPLEVEPLIETLARVQSNVKQSPVPPAATPTPKPAVNLPPSPPRPAAPPKAPKAPINWEKRLAMSIPWLGAIALAFAGIFAVKVMAAQGWFTPERRLISATIFGLGLIAFAQWVHRNQARIAEAMAAAGVTVLYAVVMAAFKLYDPPMISQITAFAAIVVITALAVFLSLRHGPLVALLGLLGGFAMPAVLNTGHPPPVELFVYLLLLEIGLTTVTRGRQWWWLTLMTMIGGLGWAAVWIAVFFDPHKNLGDAHFVGLFLLASIASFVFATVRTTDTQRKTSPLTEIIPWCAVLIGLAMVSWLIGVSEFRPLEWGFLGVLGAGCIVLGRLERRFFPLAAIAAAMGAMLLFTWGVSDGAPFRTASAIFTSHFGWTVLGLGVLYAGGTYAAMWGARRPAAWATVSALSGLVYTAVAWRFLGNSLEGTIPPWWAITAIFAGFYAVASMPVQSRRETMPELDGAMAALMVAVTALLSASAVLTVNAYSEHLGPHWITIAWALEVAALAWVGGWLKLPSLRYITGTVAAAVAVRLMANPFVLEYPIAPHVLFNWLPIGYGIPLICFIGASWRLRRDGQKALSEWLEIGAIAFAFALATLLIRHGFHPASLTIDLLGLNEFTTYSVVWMCMALVVLAGAQRWTDPIIQYGARIIAVIGLGAAIIGPGLAVNPLFFTHDVGTGLLLNGLLYAFALPAVIAGMVAIVLARNEEVALSRVFAVGAIGLGLLTTGLLVHHGFHPQQMTQHDASIVELGTYSVVWSVLGVALLAIGLRLRRPMIATLGQGVMVLSLVATLISLATRNPLIIRYPIGSMPIFNWLLYVYGLPTLLMAVAGWLTDRSRSRPLADTFGAIAMTMLAGTAALLVHHGFHTADMTIDRVSLIEFAALAVTWSLIGLSLTRSGEALQRPVMRIGGLVMKALGLVTALFWVGLITNPLWAHEPVGETPVLNWLIFAYGVPAMIALVATWHLRKNGPAPLATFTALTALLLGFALVTLEVRQAFHGNFLDVGSPSNAEGYSYSAAWILFAASLLTAGILTGGKLLRWASLAVMLMAVIKVFAFDTRHLEDLWRVLSYFGLGASLLLLAWVYQRFVFKRVPAASGETVELESQEPGAE